MELLWTADLVLLSHIQLSLRSSAVDLLNKAPIIVDIALHSLLHSLSINQHSLANFCPALMYVIEIVQAAEPHGYQQSDLPWLEWVAPDFDAHETPESMASSMYFLGQFIGSHLFDY